MSTPKYSPDSQAKKDLKRRFTHHLPGGDQLDRYNSIRGRAASLARYILHMTPTSREQSLAITKLEEAVMWANAAIARNEDGDV